jgi:hypothetical protein
LHGNIAACSGDHVKVRPDLKNVEVVAARLQLLSWSPQRPDASRYGENRDDPRP